MTPFVAALLVTATLLPATPVDFRLAGQTPHPGTPIAAANPGAPIPIAPVGPVVEAVPENNHGDDGVAPPALARPHFFVAHGFGRQVPLTFAVRQVVPSRVRVIYGSGVDAQQPVTWIGGKPWDEVLRSAVKPLGLRLVMSPMAVKIVD